MAYFVKEGKSITSRKGILAPHKKVTAEMIGDGKQLEALLEKGFLYKAEKSKPEAEKEASEKAKKPAVKADAKK